MRILKHHKVSKISLCALKFPVFDWFYIDTQGHIYECMYSEIICHNKYVWQLKGNQFMVSNFGAEAPTDSLSRNLQVFLQMANLTIDIVTIGTASTCVNCLCWLKLVKTSNYYEGVL